MQLKQDLAWKQHRNIQQLHCFRLGVLAPRHAVIQRRQPLLNFLAAFFMPDVVSEVCRSATPVVDAET
eukprot:7604609-Pyramimonas_sp.AAC.1